MKIQEIIDNLITIQEYYTPERDFSQFGYDYEPLTDEENAAIENAIEILESLKGANRNERRFNQQTGGY